jgi:hypothetical protein
MQKDLARHCAARSDARRLGRAFLHSATGVRLNELRFTEAAIPAIEAG